MSVKILEISTRLGIRDHPPRLHAKDPINGFNGVIGSILG